MFGGRKPVPGQPDPRYNQAPPSNYAAPGASAGDYNPGPPSRSPAPMSQGAYGGSPGYQQRGVPPQQQPARGQRGAVGQATSQPRPFRLTKSPNEEFIVTNLYGAVPLEG